MYLMKVHFSLYMNRYHQITYTIQYPDSLYFYNEYDVIHLQIFFKCSFTVFVSNAEACFMRHDLQSYYSVYGYIASLKKGNS